MHSVKTTSIMAYGHAMEAMCVSQKLNANCKECTHAKSNLPRCYVQSGCPDTVPNLQHPTILTHSQQQVGFSESTWLQALSLLEVWNTHSDGRKHIRKGQIASNYVHPLALGRNFGHGSTSLILKKLQYLFVWATNRYRVSLSCATTIVSSREQIWNRYRVSLS